MADERKSLRGDTHAASARARAAAPRRKSAVPKSTPTPPPTVPAGVVTPMPATPPAPTTVGEAAVIPPAIAPFMVGIESYPIPKSKAEGPRAKQFGGPEKHLIHLEPCFFPEGAEWLRTPVGLVLGVAVRSPVPPAPPAPVAISYNPTPLPRMRITSAQVVAELAAEAPGVEAIARLIILNREYNPLAVGSLAKVIKLTGFPRVAFPVPAEQLSAETLITVALEIMPVTPGARAVVRSVWLEIEG